MPVMTSGRDLRSLAGIVSRDRPDLPAEGLPGSLMGDLMGLVGCDEVSFAGMDSSQQSYWFTQVCPVGDPEDDAVYRAAHWANYRDCRPCNYADHTGDLRSITQIPDFYSTRQWHGTGMYSDFFRPQGLEHMLTVNLPEAPGPAAAPGRGSGPGLGARLVRMVFFRGPGPGFSERDRALLTLLRPHLHQAYAHAERRRHGPPDLTPRHWELLHLVGAGHTNAQIARRLGLSEGTVRKHLENIYRRLHVSSRTAAVTRAFPDQAAI